MEGCSGAHGDESNLAMADTDEPQSLEIFGRYSPKEELGFRLSRVGNNYTIQ